MATYRETFTSTIYLSIYLPIYLPTFCLLFSSILPSYRPSIQPPTYPSSSSGRILCNKHSVPQLVKKFPAFYATCRLIAALTRARYFSLSKARLNQFTTLSYFLNTNFNIILPSTPRPSKWSLSLRFPQQNSVCTSPHYVVFSASLLPRPS
jgi:hypothetical protein